MKKYSARMAENSEGDRIQELVDPGGLFYPGLKWDQISPWWSVCLDEDRIVACCQIIASPPIGHIEFMSLDEGLTDSQKAYAIKVLGKLAHIIMFKNNVYVARSCIPTEMKSYKKIVKKRWGEFQFNASVYDMRHR